jgi:hypothetical protein
MKIRSGYFANIVKVLMRCDTFPAKTYDVTKLGKCISNLSKNGNKETQDICERIKSNVIGGAENQTSNGQQPGVKSPPSNRPTPEPVAGVKRAAPGSASSDPASKRVSMAPATGNAAAKAALLKRALPVGSAPKLAPATKPAVIGATVKAKPVVTKSVISASTGAGVKKAVTKTATPSVVAAAM